MKIVAFRDLEATRISTPPECVLQKHKFIMDLHSHCVKQQSEQNFFYIKWLGLYVLAVAAFFLLGGQNFSSGFLKGVISLGCGFLFIMMWHAIFLTNQCDRKIAACILDGTALEELYPEIVISQIFHTPYKTRVSRVWFELFDRFISFSVVTFLTTASAITLFLNSLPLVISIGALAIAFLVSSFLFFRGLINKNS